MNNRKATFFSFIYRGLSSAISFLTIIATGRFLGVADRGQLQFSQVLLNGSQNFLGGYTNWYGYALPKRGEDTENIIQTGNLILCVASIFIWIVLTPLTWWLVTHHILLEAWGWMVICMPLAFLFNYATRILNALHDITWLNRSNLAQPLVFLLVYLVLLAIHPGREADRLFYSYCIWSASWVFAVILSLTAAYHRVAQRVGSWKKALGIGFSKVEWRGTVSYGSWSSISNIVHYFNYRVDYFYVLSTLGKTIFSIYGTAVGAAEVLNTLSQSIVSVVFARMTGAAHDDAISVTTKASRQSLITSTGFAFIIALAFPFLFMLLGHHGAYLKAILPFWILLPGLIFKAASNILLQYATNSLGQPKTAIWMNGLAVIINLACCVPLVHFFGMVGAALASTCAYFFGFVAYCFWFARVTGTSQRALWQLRKEDFIPYWEIILLAKKKFARSA
ncbi:lipopolysaccharide biosynthesis protein [Alicyclobacillus tolerans]|uniref:O-antigen/teichoic acid export membrane protein n=2 Tax=Alicyclobacillus tolerans TaxID=90970 RepID=A0ABT9LZN9_9BACL|nr:MULTISPECIES: polysaccharide biosynthesis C-terminal domain-containing protein [Alicyclobacillus]MDP9729723.1 O-antigen/teichoic acid export membrane protein [Alicyclobacillus tengchongensis]SHK73642.1 Membrane protein involved in the export of O-antigen and teichoic acid [Alicyclobacillus montanus]